MHLDVLLIVEITKASIGLKITKSIIFLDLRNWLLLGCLKLGQWHFDLLRRGLHFPGDLSQNVSEGIIFYDSHFGWGTTCRSLFWWCGLFEVSESTDQCWLSWLGNLWSF